MKTDIAQSLARDLVKKIKSFDPAFESKHIGNIISISDGVARISGLPKAAYLEQLEFPHGIYGFTINLEEDQIAAIILGDYLKLKEGDEVKAIEIVHGVCAGEGPAAG